MTDEPEIEVEEEQAETPELFLSDGEFWHPNAQALLDQFGGECLDRYDGSTVMYIRGKGAVNLHDLFKAAKPKKSGAVVAINGKRAG